ncbi:helix-turn-helix domain-containing protein [Streptomyces sp. bgisy095]|uniref:AraC-like ligand-binding domain-containing protein n=1 Tax=unclassified Streptomyces TaxID=2593676 RepID=UPI003D707BBE
MLLTVFDTSGLPEEDRAEAWWEVTALALVTTRFRLVEPESFGARIEAMALGTAQLSALSYSALLSQRTPQLIRRSDPEHYQLALVTFGRQGIEQARNNVLLCPGDMVLYDSSRPFDAFAGTTRDRAESLVFQFPKKLLSLPAHRAERLLATRLSASGGTGRLLSQFLTGLAEEHATMRPHDMVRLGSIGLDLVTAVLAEHLDGDEGRAGASRPHVLFLRISGFIQEHLGRPLTPAAIASAHRISLRYLQRIFQEQGTTVSDFIRQQRINRCRRDLADPALRNVPVHAIGARWGFPRPADFGHAFRKAVGMPPGRYRTAHCPPTSAASSSPGAGASAEPS